MVTAVAKNSNFCFLRDQVPLTQEAYSRTLQLRERLRTTIEGRQSYIKRTGLDPDIHLPGGNWELGGGLYEAVRTVLDGDYSILNNLRLFCQNFTGFQLTSLSLSEGKPFPREVPADLDDQL